MASEEAVVTQSLESCLCFDYFNEPKFLSCGHTFCKKCLDNLYIICHPQQNQLSCPICRHITEINNGDISKLQTNILINSMVEDVKAAKRYCTLCDPDDKSVAVQYCLQCDEYMCDPCTEAHGRYTKNTKHDVVSIDDVKRGRVKVKRFCTKHPEEEKLYVCTSCNVSICFRCHMLYHGKPDHEIEEVSEYKKTIQKQIKSLQTKGTTKIATIEAHTELVKEQKAVVEVELDQRIVEINQSYEEAVNRLTRQRNNLIDKCKQAKATHIAQLEKIKESDDIEMCCIRSASELVGNGIKALLEGQTLAVHNTISCEFEKMLDESNPDALQPKSIADSAKRMKFINSSTPNSLGELLQWQLEEVSTVPLSYADPYDAVPLPDGQVAVGYWHGAAIEMFTVNGPKETVLRNVYVFSLSILSDSRYIVRGIPNNITLYTQAWERLNVQFNILPVFNGGKGGMCVDRGDNIYVGHTAKEKIDVFRPEGGAPSREIPCHGYLPWEICPMNHSNRLVVRDRSKSVIIDNMDEEGTVLYHIQVDSENTRIAVLKDDSILIACRKDGLLSIEHYTQDLNKIGTVLDDFPLAGRIRKLLELPSGEFVVVSDDKFIVFRKI